MLKGRFADVRTLMHDAAWMAYHIAVILLSAGIALSLPAIADGVLTYWAQAENEQAWLMATEIAVATMLIVLLNYLYRSLLHKRLARMAAGAGLVAFFPSRELQEQKRIRRLKESHGLGRNLMVIGSTGYGTFVDSQGDLAGVMDKCLEAKLLLINPYSDAATARVQAIGHPEFSLARFRSEVSQSIESLKKLRAAGKPIRLKLYADPPLVKLVILGDYLWVKHYHSDLDVQTRPEYVFRHNHDDHGLYALFYQYFLQRWQNRDNPEYDFDTDELVYRGAKGTERKRERFPLEPSDSLESQLRSGLVGDRQLNDRMGAAFAGTVF